MDPNKSQAAPHEGAPGQSLDLAYLNALKVIVPGLSIAFALLVLFQFIGLTTVRPLAVQRYDAVLAAAYLVLAGLLNRAVIGLKWAYPAGFVAGLLGLGSVLTTQVFMPESSQAINLAILIFVVCFFVLSTPWLVAFIGVSVAAWGATLFFLMELPFEAFRGRFLYTALFAGMVVHFTRRRSQLRLEQLRTNIEQQKEAVSEALETAQQELRERERAEKALQYQANFQNLVTSLSTRFINLLPEQLDEAIDKAIEALGRFADVDRCYVFHFLEDGRFLDNSHEWCAEGIRPFQDHLRMVPVEQFTWAMEKHLNGEPVYFSRLDELPDAAQAERAEFERQEIRSILSVPIAAAGRVLGFLGFDSVRSEKQWTDEEIRLLTTVGEILAHSLLHRRDAEALKSSESKYRLLACNTIDAVWSVDDKARLTFISPSVETLLGYSPQELLDGDPRGLVPQEDFHRVQDYFRETLRKAPAAQAECPPIEHRIVRKSGEIVWVETRALSLFDAEGNLTGYQGASRDISARKAAEAEQAKLEDQLLQSQKLEAIGLLAGGIAHDFNNLLTGILGYSNILKIEGAEDPKIFKAADVIEKAAERASQLTNQLLRFARQDKREDRPVDLHETITEAVSLLSPAINKNIEIECELTAPQSTISGDPTQIQQVLLNLAMNARDAMPEGGRLTFRTECCDVRADGAMPHLPLKPGGYMLLTVTDTGHGIAEEHQSRIFEPFFTTKEQGKGTGMGLATAYGIVKNHHGWIGIQSRPGSGTTFLIYLPLQCEVVEVAPPVPTETDKGAGRILVVDDEDVVRDMASYMLGELGYEVVTAEDGQEALEVYAAKGESIDLVILDMVMPRLSGLECFEALQQRDPGVRVIVSSGYSLEGQAQQMSESGILGFVQKPYRMHQLAEVVSRCLKLPLEQTGS